MEPSRRTKLLTAGVILAVFVSGGVAGFATAAGEGDAAEAPRSGRRSFVFEQFDRTPEQQAQIDSILQERRSGMDRLNAELKEIRLQYQAASDSISRATGEAIALVFPPDVAAEYRQRLDERRAERARAEAERESRDDGRR